MNERRWLLGLCGLYLMLAAGYAVLMPPWEGPDEPAHYLLALNLARVGKFSSLENNYEAHQPQAYYRLTSVPLKWLYLRDPEAVVYFRPEPDYSHAETRTPIFPWSDENFRILPGMYLLRGLNILLGLGAWRVMYAGLRRLAGGRREIALGALYFGALTPQFLHTVATINNDVLGFLAGAFLFWLLSIFYERGLTQGEILLAGVAALLLPLATKLTVLPVSAAFLVILLWDQGKRWLRGRLVWGMVVFGLVVFAGLRWWAPEVWEYLWSNLIWRAFAVQPDALTPDYLWTYGRRLLWSYWGTAGWLAVELPAWVVMGLTGLAGLGAGVSFWGMVKKEIVETAKQDRGLWLVVLVGVAAVVKNSLNTIFSQGRFLFPALGPISFVVVSGWYQLAPLPFRRFLPWGILFVMLIANLVFWLGGIIPVYYQPFLG